MSADRDIERLLDAWLTDGPMQVSDHAFDEAVGRVHRQRQRPAWRVSWRDPTVSAYLKPILAIAAVIVLAVGGVAFIARPTGSGVGGVASPAPSPSTAPSASPTTAPSASAVFPTWYAGENNGAAGILTAGGQTTKSFVPRFTFTVPEGWVSSGDEAGFYGLFHDTPANQAEFAASGSLAQEIFMGPHGSPYFVCDAWEDNRGATAAEMVAAMVANEALATSDPIDVTIGGLTGKQVDVRLDSGWTDTCPGDPPTLDLGDGRTRAILLDAPDGRVIVIFVGSLHSAGHEAFLAEAMPILESFQFDTTP